MKKRLSTIALIVVFLVGLSVLLYPTVSDYLNSVRQSKMIVDYEKAISELSEKDYSKYWNAAVAYNQKLAGLNNPMANYANISGYRDTLNITRNGIIGYISIDKIRCEIPIYHGTSPEVLNVAAGHLEGTSLPVGGIGTHAVISAHRGLPSAKLFTNLDKLQNGDTFTVTVLNQVLTYEVDQVLIVLPEETQELQLQEGKDVVTLLTCTPYGINTHRLLVRGHRIETQDTHRNVFITSDAYLIEPLTVAPVVAAPILLVLLIVLMIKYRKKKK